MLDDEATIRRKIARAVTDSHQRVGPRPALQPGGGEPGRDPRPCTGVGVAEAASAHDRLRLAEASGRRRGGRRAGSVQRRYAELRDDPARVDDLLADGAARAAKQAAATLARARSAIGLA
jgi:tryptophanyl-tRNA synthetase